MIKTIDTVILVLLVFLIIKGIWRGFTKELISLVAYGSGFLAATSQLETGTKFFQSSFGFHPILGYFASYFMVFLLVFFIAKFFIRKILKLFKKDMKSGLLDSFGGAVFGFSQGMIIVGMMVATIKPIPASDIIFADKHKSLFIPLAEKYTAPLVSKFMKNPEGGMSLSDMLSMTPGNDLIMPDMMKGLLGDKIGDMMNLEENASKIMGGNTDLNEIIKKAGIDPNAPSGTTSSQLKGSGYAQALKLLKIDSSAASFSTKDLMKLLKKK